jgi:hypothetical protein
MWIEIGVTVLLTLRIVLFRLALPQLLDPTNDASYRTDGMNSGKASLPVMEK